MKEIKAVIQPGKLQKLRTALTALPNFPGMTIVRAEGCSPRTDPGQQHLDIHTELMDFSPKVHVKILAGDAQVTEIVRLIHETCRTGHRGDGIVWVTPVDEFIRIRQ